MVKDANLAATMVSSVPPSAGHPVTVSKYCPICNLPVSSALKIMGFTAIPYGLTALGVYMWSSRNKNIQKVSMMTNDKSDYGPRLSVFSTKMAACFDLLTVAPLGTALFIVTKHGLTQGHSTHGLAAFTSLMASTLFSVFAFFRKKQLKNMFYASLMITASSTLTNFFFAKVDRLAGLLILPCSLWSLYQTMQIGLAYRRLKSSQIDSVSATRSKKSTFIDRK